MSAVTFDETAAGIARRLEDRERFRCGSTLPVARSVVARRLGVPPGTLERLRSGRIKGVRAWVEARLRAAIVADLEADIARAEHELAILRLSGRRLDRQQIVEVEQSISTLRGVLRGDQA